MKINEKFHNVCKEFQKENETFFDTTSRFLDFHGKILQEKEKAIRDSANLVINKEKIFKISQLKANNEKLEGELMLLEKEKLKNIKIKSFYERLTNILLDYNERNHSFSINVNPNASLIEDNRKLTKSLKNIEFINKGKEGMKWEINKERNGKMNSVKGFYGEMLNSISQ